MAYVLTDKASGGVFAVTDQRNGNRIITLFVDKDDADRYHGLLVANGFTRPLEVLEIDQETVQENCEMNDYSYSLIEPDDIIIPPDDLEDE